MERLRCYDKLALPPDAFTRSSDARRETIARCTGGDANESRLACYDRLVGAPAPVTPAQTTAAAPPPPPPPPPPPAPTSQKVSFAADIRFSSGSSDVDKEAQARLDDLASRIVTSRTQVEVVVVIGHTDNVGSGAANQRLSLQRAESVKKYLVSKAGIEPNRIFTEGKGALQPVADNRTAEGRARNARVEIEVVGVRAPSAR